MIVKVVKYIPELFWPKAYINCAVPHSFLWHPIGYRVVRDVYLLRQVVMITEQPATRYISNYSKAPPRPSIRHYI